MKYKKYLFKSISAISFSLAFLVAFDTLVLGGKLKLIWIALANTTNASPFSTDGQSNFIFIGVFIIIALIAYINYKLFSIETDPNDEDPNDEDPNDKNDEKEKIQW